MLRRFVLLLPLFCGLAVATPVLACECLTAEVDPQVYLRDASLVFEGEVLDRPLTNWIRTTAVFHVLSPMKGRLGEQITLDQSRSGDCAAGFRAGDRVRVVAYGNVEAGYWTSACSLHPIGSDPRRDEIWALATTHRQHTLELGGADLSAADVATLRSLIRWHAEYESFEEGLDAVEQLLKLAPGDSEALQFKTQFLSAIRN